MTRRTPLSKRLIALAPGSGRRAEIADTADELDRACEGYFAEPQTVSIPKFLGAWARARKLYEHLNRDPQWSKEWPHDDEHAARL